MTCKAPHALRDALLEGAASEQKRKGLLPTSAENARFFEPFLRRYDELTAQSPPRAVPARSPQRERRLAAEAEKLGVEFSTEIVKAKASSLPPLTPRELTGAKLFHLRLERMWRDPDWRLRIEDALNAAFHEFLACHRDRQNVTLEERLAARVYALVEASNATWGDWRQVRGNPAYSLPSPS